VRILHLITTLDVGGAEMHLLAQVRGQVARGHAVRVVYLKGAGTLRADFERAGAERIEHISPAALLVRGRGPARWAELVHSHLLKADALGALLAPLSGRPLVSSKHNDEQVLRRPSVGRVHALCARAARRTIVLSDHVGRFFEQYGGVPRARQRRIYYGLDPAPFLAASAEAAGGSRVRAAVRAEFGWPAQARLAICVARFAPQKAHEDLLSGFAAARAELGAGLGAGLALLLVGDDPFGDGRQRAERHARALGLEGAVVFAGIRRDVARLYAASDLFVMTSLWEGLGLVFLEAMAAGLPVLATRVSAVPEVVQDGVTGLLVAPRAPQEVAGGLTRLAQDSELRARLGSAGRARVLADFGLERMIEETLAVYREVLSG